MNILKKIAMVLTGLLYAIAMFKAEDFNYNLQTAQYQDYFGIVTSDAPYWMHLVLLPAAVTMVLGVINVGVWLRLIGLSLSSLFVWNELTSSLSFLKEASQMADYWKAVGPVPQPPVMLLYLILYATAIWASVAIIEKILKREGPSLLDD